MNRRKGCGIKNGRKESERNKIDDASKIFSTFFSFNESAERCNESSNDIINKASAGARLLVFKKEYSVNLHARMCGKLSLFRGSETHRQRQHRKGAAL